MPKDDDGEPEVRECTVCKKDFIPNSSAQKVCSYLCRREKARHCTRINKEKRKHPERYADYCQICGITENIERHHEAGKEFLLCSNHHKLITYGHPTLKELFLEMKANIEYFEKLPQNKADCLSGNVNNL